MAQRTNSPLISPLTVGANPNGDMGGMLESLAKFGGSLVLLQRVLDTIPAAVFWKAPNLTYLGCNRVFSEIAGINNPSDVRGLSDFDMPWDREESESYRECDRRVIESGVAEIGIIESQINFKGELTWLETNKVPLHNDDQEVIGILGTFRDITGLKNAEEVLLRNNEELERRVEERTRELQFAANHDSLTKLPNRIGFVQQIKDVLQGPAEEEIALMFIDLDNFKTINDTYGHDAGDRLLKQVAGILLATVKPRDLVGRFGGDEFLLLIRNAADATETVSVCEQIQTRLNREFFVQDQGTPIEASIGIVQCSTRDYANCDDLIKDADLAMYASKNSGDSGFRLFSPALRGDKKGGDNKTSSANGTGITNASLEIQ